MLKWIFGLLSFGGAIGGVVQWGAIITAVGGALLMVRSDLRAPLKLRLEQQQAINAEVATRINAIRKDLRRTRAATCSKEAEAAAERLEQLLRDMKRGVAHLGRVGTPDDNAERLQAPRGAAPQSGSPLDIFNFLP